GVGHAPPHAITSIYTRNYTTSADANDAVKGKKFPNFVTTVFRELLQSDFIKPIFGNGDPEYEFANNE
ncbi:MAG: hypothetical protein MK060_20620, partial [Blastomonas sp.]|uniref:hypothetical protein n=1 Tax=Blastomonas sp. TaxID=1909299 RepID=UPI00406AA29A|nr:hypothetical protein [Blastomonas sp.]